MIVGVGIDSIEIARVAAKCTAAGSRFARKMFTLDERQRAALRTRAPYEHLAACFAAREAFFKATQIRYNRTSVSVGVHPWGEPFYVLVPEVADRLGSRRVHLSLTHDRTHATAVCVCEEV